MDYTAIWQEEVAAILGPGEDAKSPRVVRGYFGIDFVAMELIWQLVDAEARRFHMQRKHLLWTLYLLRVFDTIDRITTFLKVSYNTFASHVWLMISLILENVNTVRTLHSKGVAKYAYSCLC
jgi:hypothetical protein